MLEYDHRIWDTPFRIAARSLASPTSTKFRAEDWTDAYAKATDKVSADEELLRTALFFSTESQNIRNTENPIAHLSRRDASVLAVAMCNREYISIDHRSKEVSAKARAAGAVSIDHVASLNLSDNQDASPISADGALDASVDATEAWLFEAKSLEGAGTNPASWLGIAVNALRRFSLQHELNDIWNQCLWLGWRLNETDDAFHIEPGERKFASFERAWLLRTQSNQLSFAITAMAEWAKLTPSERRKSFGRLAVLDVRTKGKRRNFHVGRPEFVAKKYPSFQFDIAALQSSYLRYFLDTSLPRYPALTPTFILRAWTLLEEAARRILRDINKSEFDWSRPLDELALVTQKDDLLDLFLKGLRTNTDTAQQLLQMFTLRPRVSGQAGNKGLWSSPLVALADDDSEYAMCAPSLISGSIIRRIEAWLEQGGVNIEGKGSRGFKYEENLRENLSRSMSKNPILRTAFCVGTSVSRSPTFREEIDLVFRVGSVIFIGEIKCQALASDAIERHNALKRVYKAAEQAKRKAAYCSANLLELARATGLRPENFEGCAIHPIVVTSTSYGLSLLIDGCPIVDDRFLTVFLSRQFLETEKAFNFREGTQAVSVTLLYPSEAAAANHLISQTPTPYVLQRFCDRISWTTARIPSIAPKPLTISYPQTEDLSGLQRARMDNLLEHVS